MQKEHNLKADSPAFFKGMTDWELPSQEQERQQNDSVYVPKENNFQPRISI